MPPQPKPAIDRFVGKYVVDAQTGCWNWTAARDKLGYGYFGISRSKNVMAHRWSYEHHVGPIPEGLVIDHLCRNASCVNPAHLEPVTQRENILRGTSPMAHQARRTHCPQGHPYDEINTYIDAKGMRHCRRCGREQAALRRRRRAA